MIITVSDVAMLANVLSNFKRSTFVYAMQVNPVSVGDMGVVEDDAVLAPSFTLQESDLLSIRPDAIKVASVNP